MLGCNGCRKFGFSLCKGTKSTFLDLSKLGSDSEEIIAHLDNHFKIFEQVITDPSIVNNLIYYVIKNDLIPEHMKKLIYDYQIMHKVCGLYFYVETDVNFI